MIYNRRVQFVISSMVAGAMLTGCAGLPFGARSSARSAGDAPSAYARSSEAGPSDTQTARGGAENFVAAHDDARQAQLLLRGGKSGEAIKFAEAAVMAAPHNGENRLILAQSYMMDGRFSAAASAYEDALKLTEFQSDNIISYALAKVAEGDRAGAVEWLAGHAARLSPSDLGLALALAGDHDGALFVLGEAARRSDANAQTRQNLSLALALAGRWAQASLVSSQDLPANRVKKRMLEFSALASAPDKATQIASVMGIRRSGNAAMPARLALRNFPQENSVMPSIGAITGEDVKFASALMDSSALDASPMAVPASGDAALALVGEHEVSAPPLGHRAVARDDTEVASRPLTPVVAEALFADHDTVSTMRMGADGVAGTWAVQIGALDSAASAQRYWGELNQRSRVIAQHPASSHRAVIGRRVYYRLTLDGMTSQRAAQLVCDRLKAENKGCFVRRMTGQEQRLWSTNGRGAKLASR